MIQRILGSQFAGIPAASGIGTGFAAGGVGLMNKNWLGGSATPTGHMAVTATGTTMVLTIAGGWAVVARDQGTSSFDPRAFLAELQSSAAVTVSSNSTGSTRNDTVCLKIDQNTAPSADGSNLVSVVILVGASGGALPNAPADGNLYLPLCNVAVANLATSISQSNVTDKRCCAPGEYIPYKVRAYQTGSAQAISTATFTQVTLNTVDYDPNGNFGSSQYVVPIPGYYLVSGALSYGAMGATGQQALCLIYKNGVEAARGSQPFPASAPAGAGATVSTVIHCNAGDTLALYTYQASGSTAGLSGNGGVGTSTPFLAAHFLSIG